MRQHDPRYIAHEYLNEDWHPVMFAEVAAEMHEAKCSFIGSATLTENIDAASVPPGMAQLMAEAKDPSLRETLRDFACAQSFRRDLYRRGLAPMPAGEHQALVDALQVAATGWRHPTRSPSPPRSAPSPAARRSTSRSRPAWSRGVVSIRTLRDTAPFADRPVVELLQAITLMIAGGYAHPVIPGGDSDTARQAARALARTVAEVNAGGGDLPRLVAPLIGSSLQVDIVETLLVGLLLSGRPAEVELLAEELSAQLSRGGRTIQREGTAVTDPQEARRMAADLTRVFLEQRVPALRRLGVLDG